MTIQSAWTPFPETGKRSNPSDWEHTELCLGAESQDWFLFIMEKSSRYLVLSCTESSIIHLFMFFLKKKKKNLYKFNAEQQQNKKANCPLIP